MEPQGLPRTVSPAHGDIVLEAGAAGGQAGAVAPFFTKWFWVAMSHSQGQVHQQTGLWSPVSSLVNACSSPLRPRQFTGPAQAGFLRAGIS